MFVGITEEHYDFNLSIVFWTFLRLKMHNQVLKFPMARHSFFVISPKMCFSSKTEYTSLRQNMSMLSCTIGLEQMLIVIRKWIFFTHWPIYICHFKIVSQMSTKFNLDIGCTNDLNSDDCKLYFTRSKKLRLQDYLKQWNAFMWQNDLELTQKQHQWISNKLPTWSFWKTITTHSCK